MKRRKRKPFFWNIELYAFAAADLGEQIRQHKEADEEPWGISKAIVIRAAYVYTLTVTLVMVLGAIMCQKIEQFKERFKH